MLYNSANLCKESIPSQQPRPTSLRTIEPFFLQHEP